MNSTVFMAPHYWGFC